MTNFEDTSYTISEAAAKLQISEKTLRRWEEAGRFVSSRTDGNQRRYTLNDIQILDAIKNNVIPHQKDLLTPAIAASLLDISESELKDLTIKGEIHPFVTINNTYYPRHRLLPLLTTLKAKPSPTVQLDPTPETPLKPKVLPVRNPTPKHLPLTAHPVSTPSIWVMLAANAGITLALILGYHIFTHPSPSTNNPQPTGSVQGAATNPSLRLLDDMLDSSTGSLTAVTITSKLGTTTPNLTFTPTSTPLSPLPGNIYYDANTNTLKIYTSSGWESLATIESLSHLPLDLTSKLATPSN